MNAAACHVLPACHSHNSDPKLIRENSRTLHAGELMR